MAGLHYHLDLEHNWRKVVLMGNVRERYTRVLDEETNRSNSVDYIINHLNKIEEIVNINKFDNHKGVINPQGLCKVQCII